MKKVVRMKTSNSAGKKEEFRDKIPRAGRLRGKSKFRGSAQWRFYIGLDGGLNPQIMKNERFRPPTSKDGRPT